MGSHHRPLTLTKDHLADLGNYWTVSHVVGESSQFALCQQIDSANILDVHVEVVAFGFDFDTGKRVHGRARYPWLKSKVPCGDFAYRPTLDAAMDAYFNKVDVSKSDDDFWPLLR